MSAFKEETVLSQTHWNGDLFSVATTRNPSFRFKNGQFPMIGLEAGASLFRPAGTELALATMSVSTRPAALLKKSGNAVTTQEKTQPLPSRHHRDECPGCLPHRCLGFGALL